MRHPSTFLPGLYRRCEAGDDAGAVRQAHGLVTLFRGRGDVERLGRILAEMDVTRLTPAVLVEVLTLTFRLRTDHRARLYERARDWLTEQRGAEAADALLLGLA